MSATPSNAPAVQPAVERFLDLARAGIENHSLLKLILAGPTPSASDLQRVTIRPVLIQNEEKLSFLYRHATRDVTKNMGVDDGLAMMRQMLGRDFRNAQLTLPGEDIQLAFSKKGKSTLRIGKVAGSEAAVAQDGSHNREKHRYLSLDRPFLTELGVTDASHRLVPAMARKWKQINKFIEVFASAYGASGLADANEIKVADFGSGKGYLTFAIHDYLTGALEKPAQVTGVELRQDMVELCSDAAGKLGLQGLRFDAGDVRTYAPAPMDVMIALHACDIATDFAIHMGVRAGASVIMCSPCCHKEVRPQLLSPHPLRPILRHGIHLGQEAEMLTDGLRALLLEAAGYDTQVFEFISLEHTNKNKMILAVKRKSAARGVDVLAQIDEIKSFYGIREQSLERLLKQDALI